MSEVNRGVEPMSGERIQAQSSALFPARVWLPPMAVLVLSLLGAAWLGDPVAEPGQPVAALFPPWWDSTRSLGAAATAGGAVLTLGRLPGLVVTRSSAPGFAERLRAGGALILFDPRGLGLCTPALARRPEDERS